jgi:hypothetical protein
MPRLRQLIFFFLPVIFIYAALMIPWPGVAPRVLGFYHGVANLVYGSMGAGTAVFGPNQTDAEAADTEVTLRRPVTIDGRTMRLKGSMAFNARSRYLAPPALVLALTLSTPIAWRRRWKAIVLGQIVIHTILAVTMWILLRTSLGVMHPEPTAFQTWAHKLAEDVFSRSLALPFFLAIITWVLVSFRRGDWSRLIGRAGSAEAG